MSHATTRTLRFLERRERVQIRVGARRWWHQAPSVVAVAQVASRGGMAGNIKSQASAEAREGREQRALANHAGVDEL